MPVPPPAPGCQTGDCTVALTRAFKKMKPPLFHGEIEPLKAEAWVLGIEKLFEVFPCTEAQKVQLAAFTLEDDARRWWMLVQDKNKDITWAHFLEIFYEKYFPQCVRDIKVFEFMELKALIAEGNVANCKQNFEWKGKRQNFNKGTTSTNKKLKFGNSSNLGSTQSGNSVPTCTVYGKKHRGVCYLTTGACYQCGKMGHMAKDCTQSCQGSNRGATSSIGSIHTTKPAVTLSTTRNEQVQGRVFAIVPGTLKILR
ncbi:uncharacterized protein LOC114299695 [Camellia sinensis]|uniref:uncharacterized protein LOC114299695 n=1 Tax=Camellia sinensis TaxID=4442 RepID=UPI001035959B|nr:uncharacterized protein LOC114299695 [Camellia sinensis]